MSADPASEDIVTRLRAAGCVFAEDEAEVLVDAAASSAELEAMTVRRVSGEPLEQVVGWAAFCGLRIFVAPGVFVPRRRTELVVREAVALAAPRSVVVDLCGGTGAVGAALASALDDVDLHVADIESTAVRCARRNVAPFGGQVHQGDLYEALPPSLQGRVDILAVNAPYVPTDAIAMMPPEARLYELHSALDGGADGLDFHRRVAAGARRWLAPGGHLLIETSRRQAPRTVEAFEHGGLTAKVVRSEDLDATVVIGAGTTVQ